MEESKLQNNNMSFDVMQSILISGDLSKMSSESKLQYFSAVCKSLGLNPLTKPFDYIMLNGRETLYATRGAADQLRKIHHITVNITERKTIDNVYYVSVKAIDKDGRQDESTGAVSINGLKGESLANAIMKAETKAKRRATLSIVGLGWLDESEFDFLSATKQLAPELPQPNNDLTAQDVGLALKDSGLPSSERLAILKEAGVDKLSTATAPAILRNIMKILESKVIDVTGDCNYN